MPHAIHERGVLTDRQSELYSLLLRARGELGYIPSMRQMMHMMGLHNINAITNHLEALCTKRWIEWPRPQRGRRDTRSIKLIDSEPSVEKTDDGFVVCIPDRPLTRKECVALMYELRDATSAGK